MTPTFLSGLNDQQLEAVTLPHQSALILAGAGSGKTRVLTTRMAWLIQTGQASPMGVLAVTFTNKAAKEMLTRLTAMLPINTRGMWVGTFHGLCNRMLRAHYREAGLPQLFQILDTQDQLALVKRLMKAMNYNEEEYSSKDLQWFIAKQKDAGLRAGDIGFDADISQRQIDFYAEYDVQCQREGVVDFAELLLRSYELLSRNDVLREHYASRFRHILVDEFQDTNRLQYRWLQQLAGAESAIFAVGDDDQSIYGWRGASTANMQDLQRDFRIDRVIKLEQNYRSHGNILEAANTLIAHNRNRLGKELWTEDSKGEPLRVFEAATEYEEAGYVVEEVRKLRAAGVRLSDMAVLYRSNAQSRVIEHSLFTAGMPYRVYGGLRFFERKEVKDVLAYLRLLANQDDDGALLRVINQPKRGIGAGSLEQLQAMAREGGMSLWAAACANKLSGKAAASIAVFIRLIEAMRSVTAGLSLHAMIDHVVEHSGLAAFYRDEKEGADRLENLGELVNAAELFVKERSAQTLAEGAPPEDMDELTAFLAHAALEAGDNQAEVGADALQLMTVHSAKGLEFHAVFITGLEDDLFPHVNSSINSKGIEEERRLMYVALTRARRRLHLSYATSRTVYRELLSKKQSRFLEELPQHLLQSVSSFRQPSDHIRQRAAIYGGMSNVAKVNAATSALRVRELPWGIGQEVRHAKFGVGVVVAAEGSGADIRVQVNFRSAGSKWLALAYAKLEAA